MTHSHIKILSFLISIILFCQNSKAENKSPLLPDGPYIVYDSLGCGATIVSVNTKGQLLRKHVRNIPSDYSFKVTTSDARHTFSVSLHNVQQPAWNYAQPERMFITSDPHADFESLFTLLKGNGVIDSQCNWTFGNGHLALIGDVMDRGNDAVAIYWLLYKLEAQAAKAGGALHFMMGNHEPMVLMDDNRYTHGTYVKLADTLGVKYSHFFTPRTELGRWLLSRNTIERIGRNLLVHAGLSSDLYDTNLTIPEINALMPLGLYKHKAQRRKVGSLVSMLHASYGPIWYRGLVLNDAKYRPIKSDSLDLILRRFDADRIIVGHTIFDTPCTFYNGRVVAVNVDNKENREANRPRAVLMENNTLWLVDDKGNRTPLK